MGEAELVQPKFILVLSSTPFLSLTALQGCDCAPSLLFGVQSVLLSLLEVFYPDSEPHMINKGLPSSKT